MTNTNRIEPLSVSVLFAAQEVALNLRDRRPDSIALFGDLYEPARDQFAHDAWAISLRALSNAHQKAQESKLKDVGTASAISTGSSRSTSSSRRSGRCSRASST